MKRILYNRALRVLIITNGFVLLAGAMIGPILALYVEDIGGDLLDASLTGGLFALAAGVTSLVAGRYVDHHTRSERIVAFGYAVMGIGFLLYTVVDSIWMLFAVQIVVGFAEALYTPAFDALFSSHVTKKKAGREWATWESLNYFSIAIGAAVGGFIVSQFGFTVMFVLMALLCFAGSAYIVIVPRRVFR